MKNSLYSRAKLVCLFIVVFSFFIVAKIINIQFVNKSKWDKLLHEKFFVIKEIPATRGNILSDSGDLLATSLPFYEIAFDPTVVDEKVFLENINDLSEKFSTFFKTHDKTYYNNLFISARKQNKKYIRIKERLINHNEKKEILSWPIFKLGKYRGGLILEKQTKRFYPFKSLARRTIGYVREDRKVGLEKGFDELLSGTNGEALYQKIIGNNYKIVNNEANQKPIDGLDIVTTLNVNLQDIAHSSLLKILKECQGNYGVVIIMEVKTGHIKAIVNLERGEDGQYRESYNYAIGNLGCVEPGSVMKTVSMLALFEESGISFEDKVDTGRGSYKFHGLVMHDVNPLGYGVIDLKTAFEKSSNIGIAKIIKEKFQNDPNLFLQYFHKLKLDEPLNSGISGEGKPFFNNPQLKTWSKDSLPWMSIGYQMRVSPLQILTFYNAIANDGVMLKPIFVSEVKKGLTTVKKFSPEVLCKEICSQETLKKIKILLEGVVQNGTAQKYKHGFYQIAGKSGTVNKLKNGMYTSDTLVNFAGYFPSDNPVYSCIVVVDEPKGEDYHFGSQVGAPVLKAIADNVASMDVKASPQEYPQKAIIKNGTTLNVENLLNISDDLEFDVENFKNNDAKFVQKTSTGWKEISVEEENKIPNLYHMVLKDVLSILMVRDIKYELQGNIYGKVVTQSLKPGTPITEDAVLIIEMK